MAMGTVESARKEVFKIWRSSLRELARRPNVMVKVGGLGMPFWGFGFEERKGPVGFEELAETWAPYVETGIEIFGADRCMMQSNFPADGHSCGYVPLWNALKTIVKSYSPADKAKLFSRTASRVYNIPIDFAADL
jgi:predicted TIM-barrel fold metal-dependent hydrolase